MNKSILRISIKLLLRLRFFDCAVSLVESQISKGIDDFQFLLDVSNDFFFLWTEEAMAIVIKISEYIHRNATGEPYITATGALGMRHFVKYQFREAIAYLSELVEFNRPKYLAYLIYSLIYQKEFDVAKEYLVQAKTIWEFNPDVVYFQAEIFRIMGKDEEANQIIEEYFASAPELVASNFMMGEQLRSFKGDYVSAEKHFETAFSFLQSDRFVPQ